MKRLIKACFFLTLSFSALCLPAQSGFFIGPALGAGVNYSKNFVSEPESQFFIENKMGLYGFGGLDLMFAIDDYTGIHAGIQYGYKQYTLDPPGSPEGLSFESISTSSGTISIPLMVHRRFNIGGEGSTTKLNIMAGISIDMIQGDSLVDLFPLEPADSGSSVYRHTIQHLDKTVTTPLIGAGIDMTLGSGILNITAMWSPGTAIVAKGDIREWNSINETFDPFQADEPLQFPDHYFDFGMRGSTVSLRLSYMFNLGNPFEKKDPFGDEE